MNRNRQLFPSDKRKMNKLLVAVALLACSCRLLAYAKPIESGNIKLESSFLNPDDDDEIRDLDDRTRIYSDFCLATRDYIMDDIRVRRNEQAAVIFSHLLRAAVEIGMTAAEVSRLATDKMTDQIREPEAAIAKPTTSLERIIAIGQKAISDEQNAPMAMLTGTLKVLSLAANAVTSELQSRFQTLQSQIGPELIIKGFTSVCDTIDTYDSEINKQFFDYQTELIAANASVQATTLDQVQCVTARRVIRLDGLCKFVISSHGHLIKAITYKSS